MFYLPCYFYNEIELYQISIPCPVVISLRRLTLAGGDRKATNSEQLLERTVQFIGKLEVF